MLIKYVVLLSAFSRFFGVVSHFSLWLLLKVVLCCSWAGGAHPWGPEKDAHFTAPNHWDGLLEVVGVTGVVHMGKISGGLGTAIRLAQGTHVSI